MKKHPLVEIFWEDSRSPESGWQFLTEVDTPNICKCKTVGYLIEKTTTKIVVAQNMGDVDAEDVQVNGLMTIPARCVTQVRTLKKR